MRVSFYSYAAAFVIAKGKFLLAVTVLILAGVLKSSQFPSNTGSPDDKAKYDSFRDDAVMYTQFPMLL